MVWGVLTDLRCDVKISVIMICFYDALNKTAGDLLLTIQNPLKLSIVTFKMLLWWVLF